MALKRPSVQVRYAPPFEISDAKSSRICLLGLFLYYKPAFSIRVLQCGVEPFSLISCRIIYLRSEVLKCHGTVFLVEGTAGSRARKIKEKYRGAGIWYTHPPALNPNTAIRVIRPENIYQLKPTSTGQR